MILLSDFLARSVMRGEEGLDAVSPCGEVTALMYFFWREEDAAAKWPSFEGALLETWRNCGRLKTVVVTNRRHRCVTDFAARFRNVEIQLEERLVPGDINSMSVDCNARLAKRFSTKYVLIVQDDGFPLRPGLEYFVQRCYDFIGSPYCRAKPIPNLLTAILNYCPSNGGFSLRSRRLCELSAEYWRRFYATRDFVVMEMSEDLFYTKTLPRRFPRFWLSRRQAPSIIAECFSYEGVFPLYSREMPFGFHTAAGFAEVTRRFARPGGPCFQVGRERGEVPEGPCFQVGRNPERSDR